MPNLDLNNACWDYDRTRPLTDGRVKPEGINLDITVLRPREIFPRMLQDQEFHASEMSLASYVILKARDQCPFVAIPVMLSRYSATTASTSATMPASSSLLTCGANG